MASPRASKRPGSRDALPEGTGGLIGISTSGFLRAHCNALVTSRLARRLREAGDATFSAYLSRVFDDAAERQVAIDLLTTNETYFFREPAHFDFRQRLPDAHHRVTGDGRQQAVHPRLERARALGLGEIGCDRADDWHHRCFREQRD